MRHKNRYFSNGEVDKPIVSNFNYEIKAEFMIVISTARLMSLLRICICLRVDSTYKLNFQK